MANLMTIGGHVFQVVGLNGQTIETTTEAVVAEFGRWGMVDGAQFHGMRRATEVITGVLFPDAIGGRPDYEALRSSQYRGKALPMLQMSAGFTASVLGMVLIERVSDLAEYGGQKLSFDIELRADL